MYLRTFKQFLRSLQPAFDERQFGFSSTYELARQAQRDGLLRVERNRQGILRIYPGERFPRLTQEQPADGAAPMESVETDLSSPLADLRMPDQEPEPVLQSELPDGFAEIGAEIVESATAAESELATVVESGHVEILEEVVGESAPKARPKRTRKPAGARTARTPRKARSKAASSG
jgi:hypothetical protein